MRPIRTIAPLALGLVALAATGCQSQPRTANHARPGPGRASRSRHHRPGSAAQPPSQPPARPASKPAPAPAPETIVGLWPAKTLDRAQMLQAGADDGHESWALSPELVSTSYAAAELNLFEPVARKVGPTAYEVGARNSECVATLHLAQPVRQGSGGIWVITRTGKAMGSY